MGRVDLSKNKNDLRIEGESPFWKHSDSPVAAYGADGNGSECSYGGSSYGVSNHKSHEIEDNWH